MLASSRLKRIKITLDRPDPEPMKGEETNGQLRTKKGKEEKKVTANRGVFHPDRKTTLNPFTHKRGVRILTTRDRFS